MDIFLLTDIGSTYTKVAAVNIKSQSIVGFAKSFTTAEDNVLLGYEAAKNEVLKQVGNIQFKMQLAASSAAGGLKMVSVGLVPELTAKASRLASTSAGAKVISTYSYELTSLEQNEIEHIKPDILLLSGGIDGGNKKVLLHNAQIIASINACFPVIIAGNRSCAAAAQDILQKGGKPAIICENVMPVFGKLNILPAKNAIRELFIKNIISAKGLDKVQAILSNEIIPTPLAVLNACRLLAKGTETQKGLGELMAYDLGGATTDVYSMADGSPKMPNAFISGITEPFDKRTVEGDIGMRYSQRALYNLLEEQGLQNFLSEYNLKNEDIKAWLNICQSSPNVLPIEGYAKYSEVDIAFATEALRISAARHVGYNEAVYTSSGQVYMQTGKDLTSVLYIIGSGGAVINAKNPSHVLQKTIYSPKDLQLLKPLGPKLLLDKKNILAAMGLLSVFEPDAALAIMKNSLLEVHNKTTSNK